VKRLFSGKKMKRRISFSPAPTVHEFDCSSPSTRRLDIRKNRRTDDVDRLALHADMQARGMNPTVPSERKLVIQAWNNELKQDLEKFGLGTNGSNQELNDRLDLAKALRRRAHLRLSGTLLKLGEATFVRPADLTIKELTVELEKRKIVTKIPNKLAKIVAIEEALLKESEGLIGDGYDFGRRFVSAEDVFQVEEFTDSELRSEIKARGHLAPRRKGAKIDLLNKLLENELETDMREAFVKEVLDEVERRGGMAAVQEASKRELAKSPKSPTMYNKRDNVPSRKRRIESEELLLTPTKPAKRAKSALGGGSPPARQVKIEPTQEEIENEKKMRDLFDLLFTSNLWRDDYATDDEPETRKGPSASCLIS